MTILGRLLRRLSPFEICRLCGEPGVKAEFVSGKDTLRYCVVCKQTEQTTTA